MLAFGEPAEEKKAQRKAEKKQRIREDGTPLQCSCLENPRDGGAWWAEVYVVAESDMTKVT